MSRRQPRDAAFTEFAAAVAPRLFRSAVLMSGDWHLAQDLVQTTLSQLYVRWGKITRADSPEAYAHGALVKAYLSHKRVRRNSELPSSELGDRATPQHDPAARVIVAEALRILSPLDRAIVVLRYWDDRTVVETALEVGLSSGAVRTRASRALAVLRSELADAKEIDS
ncbi:MAG: SigE family RNA polymerase sigma factor [Nocardioidaceae bacterium]